MLLVFQQCGCVVWNVGNKVMLEEAHFLPFLLSFSNPPLRVSSAILGTLPFSSSGLAGRSGEGRGCRPTSLARLCVLVSLCAFVSFCVMPWGESSPNLASSPWWCLVVLLMVIMLLRLELRVPGGVAPYSLPINSIAHLLVAVGGCEGEILVADPSPSACFRGDRGGW